MIVDPFFFIEHRPDLLVFLTNGVSHVNEKDNSVFKYNECNLDSDFKF